MPHPIRKLSPAALKGMLNDAEELALIDVREDGQFGLGHLLYAAPAPYSRLEARIAGLVPRRSAWLVLVDDADGVGERAARRLRHLGFTEVSVLAGGFQAWADAGYELFKGVNVPSKAFGEIVEHECGTPSISAAELQAKISAGEDVIVLDSRPMAEYYRQSIPRGINCPGAELAYRVHDLAPDPRTCVVVNCAGRTRSIIGAQSLINGGLPNQVVALRNGTMGWQLAGYRLDRGMTRRYPDVSPEGLAKAMEMAGRVRRRFGVREIGRRTLEQWRAESDRRSLYLLDVRDPEEYRQGHVPGSVPAPGGQLVQATDRWLATRGARVVLIDDNGVRAAMTAHWLLQMGWEAFVLEGGIASGPVEAGAHMPAVLGLDEIAVDEVSPAALRRALSKDAAVVLDVGSSMEFRRAHVPGATWACRPRLDRAVDRLPGGGRIVLTAGDDVPARLAAVDLMRLTSAPVAVLRGGTAGWTAAGLATEGSAEVPSEEACIDHLFWAHDHHRGNRASMRDYLDWETSLPAQIRADGGARFRISSGG